MFTATKIQPQNVGLYFWCLIHTTNGDEMTGLPFKSRFLHVSLLFVPRLSSTTRNVRKHKGNVSKLRRINGQNPKHDSVDVNQVSVNLVFNMQQFI